MCGRFAQYRIAWEYLEPIGLQLPLLGGVDPEPINRYNVAPRSRVRILHPDPDGLRWDLVPWGWEPFWAKGKRPPAINARGETAATGKFFKQIWESGRCVIPADGWYEWVKDSADPKKKQPYYIHRRDKQPMYFAGIGQFRRDGSEPQVGDGFVIITADSDQGMVDIHDRRPVVLSSECAANWIDPELEPVEAEEIMHQHGESVEVFEWYPVGREVGNVRNEGAGLIKCVTD
ncbi:Putative SOS response-associated peptidase YedK [Halopseudomonas litoralis]|uniref:Abasic site processing protein n=1 Tax=Halopseudomonas litoralis TaxID=797277 RepID=A0A1H1NZI0_9GAMM|nr:SOS response-associated peptidase family protein [Halopseudomonas litoralis]SDS04378.1 Putative SOS response-associated peptidase YedK [Halopseudomonas litoralis]